jgi:putative intracellular protease/amidase
MKVYIIASYQSAGDVRAIHDALRTAGHEPTSSWAETAAGPEDLASLTAQECGAIWDRNDADLLDADVVMVLADTPCREGFLEAQRAMDLRKRIVWIGRPVLSVRAYIGPASRLVVVGSVVDGLALLAQRGAA